MERIGEEFILGTVMPDSMTAANGTAQGARQQAGAGSGCREKRLSSIPLHDDVRRARIALL
jgi:hypothetical protein